jgi:hypothetical protein
MANPLHLFKSGEHSDRYGRVYTFSLDDVREMGDSYNPETYTAPIQIDHEGTLIGGKLLEAGAVGGHLMGIPSEIMPAFAKQAAGKQISLQLFTPDATDNPSPGHWGISHVALVDEGAIKLLPPSFSAPDEQHPVFSMPATQTQFTALAAFLLALRELFSGFSGEGEAEYAEPMEEPLPEDLISQVATGDQSAIDTAATNLATYPGYSKAKSTKEPSPLEKELADTKQRLRKMEIGQELDRLVFGKEIKLPPRYRGDLVTALAAIEGQTPLQFSTREATSYQFWLDLLADLPTVVTTGEAPEFKVPDKPMAMDPKDPKYSSPAAEEIRQYARAAKEAGREMSFTEARAEMLKKGHNKFGGGN